jgi:steroid delta-isomerase-like uncharacterized protein
VAAVRPVSSEPRQRVVEALDTLFNQGDLGAAGQFVHAQFVNHEAAARRPPGPEGMRQTIAWLRDAFSDLHLAVDDVIAQGDKVVARVTMTGHHTGVLMGMPPTGRAASVQHIHIFRVADGKLVEHWATRNDLGLMVQLGLMPEIRNHR